MLIFKDTYTECIRINQGKPDIILGQKIKAGQFFLNNSALQSRKQTSAHSTNIKSVISNLRFLFSIQCLQLSSFKSLHGTSTKEKFNIKIILQQRKTLSKIRDYNIWISIPYKQAWDGTQFISNVLLLRKTRTT